MSNAAEAGSELVQSEAGVQPVDDAKSAPADRDTAGPFDVSEVPAIRPYVDLGALKVAPREGLQLRLEVDERASRVIAVSIGFAESVMQVQAFAAPKTTGLWGEIRAEAAAQARSQGSAVTEEQSELGTELVVQTAATAADGTNAMNSGAGSRSVRLIGVDGPRWLLRAAVLGAGATDAAAREAIVDVLRELVVVRGDLPIPPGELLPLRVPPGFEDATPTPASNPASNTEAEIHEV